MNEACYVYILLDPTQPGRYTYDELGVSFLYQPFYAGKGSYNRAYKHTCPSAYGNEGKMAVIRKAEAAGLNVNDYIVKYRTDLSDSASYELEESVIQAIGRIVVNTGPLTNLNPGGQGGKHLRKLKLSKQDVQNVIKLYLEGYNQKEIAVMYNVCATTIRKSLVNNKIEIRPFMYSPADVYEMKTDYLSGVSVKEIAKKFDTPPISIYTVLKREGVFVSAHEVIKQKALNLANELVEEYTNGASLAFLHRKYNLCTDRIRNVLIESGITLRARAWNCTKKS